ncbi:MAG: glucosaminidase domain-containing protein [Saprospiraceae bacterium]
MPRYSILVAALLGLLTASTTVAQGYMPQSKEEMVEMLAARCGRSPSGIWEIIHAAEEVKKIFGIPVSVTLAILLVESDGTQSDLCRLANNCLGLTESFDHHGGPVYCKKHLVIDRETGRRDVVEVCFRAYPSIEACLLDFGAFVSSERRWWYADAFRCPMFDPECWLDAMAGDDKEPGYAADWKNWQENCLNVIRAYNLKLADR